MRLFGIPVKVDGSFVVVILFLAWGRVSEPVLLAEWLLVVFVSIMLHEFGHALAGRAFGLEPQITLYSLGGLTSWRGGGGELSPPRHVAISLAGPLAGFLFGGLVYLARPLFESGGPGMLARTAFRDLLWVNVGWGLFNLLPILPLDGGQALLSVERAALRRRTQWLTPAVSLLAAAAVAAWALSVRYVWVALLGGWFAVSNGQTLLGMFHARRDRALDARLAEGAEAYDARDFGRSAALAREVLGRAKTDALKKHASRLLVLSLALREGADAAEVDGELRRHQVFFGEEPFLEGFVLMKTGRAPGAVAHLRAAFESSRTKETGLALYESLVRARLFGEALELCAHASLADVARSAYEHLQLEAFEAGEFETSARAGESAFRVGRDARVAFNVACAYARGGDRENAIAWLDAALAEGFDDAGAFDADSDLDSLRGSREFEALGVRLRAAVPRKPSGAAPS